MVIGTGSIDIKGVVAAGAAAGVEMHYLEDESPDVLTQVPRPRPVAEPEGEVELRPSWVSEQ